jgi:hypothetical protein
MQSGGTASISGSECSTLFLRHVRKRDHLIVLVMILGVMLLLDNGFLISGISTV